MSEWERSGSCSALVTDTLAAPLSMYCFVESTMFHHPDNIPTLRDVKMNRFQSLHIYNRAELTKNGLKSDQISVSLYL